MPDVAEDDDFEYDGEDDEDDDESYESEEDDGSGRTLLFLCEEGQLDIALKRVKQWDELFPLPVGTNLMPANEDSESSPASATHAIATEGITEATIHRELFRKNPNTGNYCLHEILAGGTSGNSAPELVECLVRRYRSLGSRPLANNHHFYQEVFMAQPTVGSNGRTILHWCAWSKTTPNILKLVLGACPEAMCLRDNKSHFSRTPLEIAQRYWPDDEITNILKSSLQTYLPYRLRIYVQLCAERLFLHQEGVSQDAKEATKTSQRYALKPFDKQDRRIAGLAPRSWFVASVLGYALQREMKGLALRILSFVGCGAKLESKKRKERKQKARRADTKARKKRKTR